MFPTRLEPWNKAKITQSGLSRYKDPGVIIMQSLRSLAGSGGGKGWLFLLLLLSSQEHVSYLYLDCTRKGKIVVCSRASCCWNCLTLPSKHGQGHGRAAAWTDNTLQVLPWSRSRTAAWTDTTLQVLPRGKVCADPIPRVRDKGNVKSGQWPATQTVHRPAKRLLNTDHCIQKLSFLSYRSA